MNFCFRFLLSTPFDLWFESSPPRGIDPDTFKSTLVCSMFKKWFIHYFTRFVFVVFFKKNVANCWTIHNASSGLELLYQIGNSHELKLTFHSSSVELLFFSLRTKRRQSSQVDCFEMLPNYTNLRLFRVGIRPMWEDEANRAGGRWWDFKPGRLELLTLVLKIF